MGSDNVWAGGPVGTGGQCWAGESWGAGGRAGPVGRDVSSMEPCARSSTANRWAPRHSDPLASVQERLVKVWFPQILFQTGKWCVRNCTKSAVG